MTKDEASTKRRSSRIGAVGALFALIPALAFAGYAGSLTQVDAASDSDLCVTAVRADDTAISAQRGWCSEDTVTPIPTETETSTPAPTATETPTPTETPTQSPPMTTVGYASSWGVNTVGQLGNDSTVTSSVPVNVLSTGALSGKTVTGVSAGVSHSCAIADGGAYCWGQNSHGQLGNGTTTSSVVPVTVNTSGVLSGKTVTSISAGNTHTCAVADGAAYCWGENNYGQLGDGTTTAKSNPVVVKNDAALLGATVTSISAGTLTACAIADGSIYCWGLNADGQLGNGTTSNRYTPVAVKKDGVLSGKTVTYVDAGNSYACAVADGSAYCWGYNGEGRLGNGTTANSSVPTAVKTDGVLSGRSVSSISANAHTCAVANGAAYCWGGNHRGQLGDGTTINRPSPVAVKTDGSLFGTTVTDLTTGGVGYQTCAVANGAAYCWGQNNYGQLGNGTTTNSSYPVAVRADGVLAGKTLSKISAGDYHILALYS